MADEDVGAVFFFPPAVSGSSTFDAEPTETYMRLPSGENAIVHAWNVRVRPASRGRVRARHASLEIAVLIRNAKDNAASVLPI